MSRYVNAEKMLTLISALTGAMPVIALKLCETDGVDIIRCGKCKYYVKDYTGEWCDRFRYPHGCKADGFCSYGERKDNETD